jgi:hypothetical protein
MLNTPRTNIQCVLAKIWQINRYYQCWLSSASGIIFKRAVQQRIVVTRSDKSRQSNIINYPVLTVGNERKKYYLQ